MALLSWKSEFETGIPSVDYEHQVLIASLREIAEQLHNDSPLSDILNYLGLMHARIEAHFALEEKIMLDRKYDSYTEHKADHDRLLEDIRDIMDNVRINSGVDEIRDTLIRDIDSWFSFHFLNMDIHYHEHVDGAEH